MSASRPSGPARTMLSGMWAMPVLLAVCTAIALGVGLLYDGLWDVLASLLLGLPALSFLERVLRRRR